MRQDLKAFLIVFQDTLYYLFSFDIFSWWEALVEKGTDRYYLAGLILVLALIGIGGFFLKGFRYIAHTLLIAFLIGILTAGETPSMQLMTLTILYITVTVAFGNGKRKKVAAGNGCIILVISVLLLLASSFAGVPILKRAFGDVLPLRTKIQNTSLVHVLNELLPNELKFQDGTGEYEGGSLETGTNGPEFTGRTVVSVESDTLPTKPYYWKRYEGNVYTGYSFDASGNLDNPRNRASIRYPKEKLEALAAFCAENPVQGGEAEIRDFIIQTLAERTNYKLAIEAVPEGKDFIEHFFFGSQEGYCIHYAATAVMMFRMYGIPAKYVTGFVIPPEMFYMNSEGVYQADVPDVQAHAWVRIYVAESEKWIDVEVTPPAGVPTEMPEVRVTESETNGGTENAGTEGNESETGITEQPTELIGTAQTERNAAETEKIPQSESESETSANEETDTESENASEINEETEALPDLKVNTPSWFFLPVILLLALVLILAGLFIRRVLLLERRKKQNVQAMFADLYEVMIQNGLPVDVTLLSEDFSEKVLAAFPMIDEVEWKKVIDIVLRATYGPEQANTEEWMMVNKMYYSICRSISKRLKGMRKITFYLVDVWI